MAWLAGEAAHAAVSSVALGFHVEPMAVLANSMCLLGWVGLWLACSPILPFPAAWLGLGVLLGERAMQIGPQPGTAAGILVIGASLLTLFEVQSRPCESRS